MLYTIKLNWKEFNVCLNAVDAWLKENTTGYCGFSANSVAEVHFNNEPSQEDKDAVVAYWDGLSDESDEAEAYKSVDERAAEKEAKRASAKAKLILLGLAEDEVDAFLG